jgi:hypothetical protein
VPAVVISHGSPAKTGTSIIENAGSLHDRAYNVRLSGSSLSQYARLPDKAATDEGNFIAALFRLDINARIGHYKTLDDFIEYTTSERDRVCAIPAGSRRCRG